MGAAAGRVLMCVSSDGPWPWARRGENEAVRFCACVRARVRDCNVCSAIRTVVCVKERSLMLDYTIIFASG